MELKYNFTIKHHPGKHNANADALSCMYDDQTDQEEGNECFLVITYDADTEEDEPEAESSSIALVRSNKSR